MCHSASESHHPVLLCCLHLLITLVGHEAPRVEWIWAEDCCKKPQKLTHSFTSSVSTAMAQHLGVRQRMCLQQTSYRVMHRMCRWRPDSRVQVIITAERVTPPPLPVLARCYIHQRMTLATLSTPQYPLRKSLRQFENCLPGRNCSSQERQEISKPLLVPCYTSCRMQLLFQWPIAWWISVGGLKWTARWSLLYRMISSLPETHEQEAICQLPFHTWHRSPKKMPGTPACPLPSRISTPGRSLFPTATLLALTDIRRAANLEQNRAILKCVLEAIIYCGKHQFALRWLHAYTRSLVVQANQDVYYVCFS